MTEPVSQLIDLLSPSDLHPRPSAPQAEPTSTPAEASSSASAPSPASGSTQMQQEWSRLKSDLQKRIQRYSFPAELNASILRCAEKKFVTKANDGLTPKQASAEARQAVDALLAHRLELEKKKELKKMEAAAGSTASSSSSSSAEAAAVHALASNERPMNGFQRHAWNAIHKLLLSDLNEWDRGHSHIALSVTQARMNQVCEMAFQQFVRGLQAGYAAHSLIVTICKDVKTAMTLLLHANSADVVIAHAAADELYDSRGEPICTMRIQGAPRPSAPGTLHPTAKDLSEFWEAMKRLLRAMHNVIGERLDELDLDLIIGVERFEIAIKTTAHIDSTLEEFQASMMLLLAQCQHAMNYKARIVVDHIEEIRQWVHHHYFEEECVVCIEYLVQGHSIGEIVKKSIIKFRSLVKNGTSETEARRCVETMFVECRFRASCPVAYASSTKMKPETALKRLHAHVAQSISRAASAEDGAAKPQDLLAQLEQHMIELMFRGLPPQDALTATQHRCDVRLQAKSTKTQWTCAQCTTENLTPRCQFCTSKRRCLVCHTEMLNWIACDCSCVDAYCSIACCIGAREKHQPKCDELRRCYEKQAEEKAAAQCEPRAAVKKKSSAVLGRRGHASSLSPSSSAAPDAAAAAQLTSVPAAASAAAQPATPQSFEQVAYAAATAQQQEQEAIDLMVAHSRSLLTVQTDPNSNEEIKSQPARPSASAPKQCSGCDNIAPSDSVARCKHLGCPAVYCSGQCQRNDRPEHMRGHSGGQAAAAPTAAQPVDAGASAAPPELKRDKAGKALHDFKQLKRARLTYGKGKEMSDELARQCAAGDIAALTQVARSGHEAMKRLCQLFGSRPPKCFFCGKFTNKPYVCTCETTEYCSEACQRDHWEKHRTQHDLALQQKHTLA